MSKYRTPLRYPGGKQRLAPFILEILRANGLIGAEYGEPYAGGAGAGIELLLDGYVGHIHLNDSSFPVYAFWNSVKHRSDDLCRLISSASLTVEEWKKRREIVQRPEGHDELEVGFSTFYLNRCNRSGVLSGGLIGGLAQTGEWKMDARFPRNDLIRRVELIASRANSITVTHLDAEVFILEYIPQYLPERAFIYCDPPYFHKASGLYLNHYKPGDHERIARIIQEDLHRPWAVSYDNAVEILAYYQKRESFLYDLQYNAARVYKGKEVFIFSDSVRVPAASSLPYINDALQGPRASVRQLQFTEIEV